MWRRHERSSPNYSSMLCVWGRSLLDGEVLVEVLADSRLYFNQVLSNVKQ